MRDLIKRSDAIKALYKYSFVSKDVIEREIKAIPTADRPMGEWMDKTIPVSKANPYGGIIVGTVCPVCGYDGEDEQLGKISYRIVSRFNFCPNCGARMKGADDE